MKESCRRIVERFTAYLDEALGPQEQAEVEQHLNACPPCREDASRQRGAREVLRACADRLREGPLPPGLRARCEAAAKAQARRARRPE
jgi:anti-sigma factor RsiW